MAKNNFRNTDRDNKGGVVKKEDDTDSRLV